MRTQTKLTWSRFIANVTLWPMLAILAALTDRIFAVFLLKCAGVCCAGLFIWLIFGGIVMVIEARRAPLWK